MERHHFIRSDYVEHALAAAVYDKFEDGSFAGKIPGCVGVLASTEGLRECEAELRSTLEHWILVGLKLDHGLPVLNGIDLIASQPSGRDPLSSRPYRRPSRDLSYDLPMTMTELRGAGALIVHAGGPCSEERRGNDDS